MSTESIRFAQFNASLNRRAEGQLVTDLSDPNAATPGTAQAKAIAEIIQRTDPDVVLINEFDYFAADPSLAVKLFLQNYLAVSQNRASPVEYPYFYIAPSNTGIPSGFDLDNNGSVVTTPGQPGYGNDAFGFGNFPGQFGMLLLSKYPIDTANVRTFQKFLWQDMPGSLLPTIALPDAAEPWYSPEEQAALRLSSKSHWDVPIQVNGKTVHALVSHPTPPVFDGAEDRNGKRNHDEIRFWADYVTPGQGNYIYDDQGRKGGLMPEASFVIMGDQNADPFDGDSFQQAILQLLNNSRVNTSVTPTSAGGPDAAQRQHRINDQHRGNPAFDTADFSDTTPGNLRADYVLPSQDLAITDAQVFWPAQGDPLFRLVGDFDPNLPPEGFPSSDHRLVWVDVHDPRRSVPNSLLGIASGDTNQTSTVLWAWSSFTGNIKFEFSIFPDFQYIFGYNSVNVNDPTVPVKVSFGGLTPGQTYYYRVTDAAGAVATGQLQTPNPLDVQAGLRFGVTGDWQQAPPFPSLSNADERDLAFFLKLGDTIYADTETPALPGVTQARTLSEFRTKQAENVSDRFGLNTLKDLYASTSIFATIDDHELVDNFAGGAAPGESPDAPDIGSSPDPLFTDAVRYVNDTRAYEEALQAFQEYHPINDRFYGETGDARTAGERQLYRYTTYGKDAAMMVLDTRSFRDAQLAPADLNNPLPFLAQTFDPSRTLLGKAQLNDLKQDLLTAEQNGITWKFVAVPEPIQNFGIVNADDRFEGYAAERTELLKFIDDNNIDNVIFLAGDFHGTLVNNLTYQLAPGQPQIATNAFEVVTGPAAFFDGVFGRAVVDISTRTGLITAEQRAFYDQLPIAPDSDSLVNDRDDFIKQLLVEQTNLLGYDPIGLNNNLPQADGLIQANLLQGDYVSVHTYGWTEFDIDPQTQKLTVTTYGINNYSEAELLQNPGAITGLTPRVVSQFEVMPVL